MNQGPGQGRNPVLRQGRGRPIFLLSLVVVGGLVVAGPWVAARTALRDTVLREFVRDWPGPATAGSARLGWLTPVEFHDVRLTSPNGNITIEIPSLVATEPLWVFAFTHGDLGGLSIRAPSAEVIVQGSKREKSEVAEDIAHPPAEPSPERPSKRPVDIDVEITQLAVKLHGTVDENWTTIDPVNLKARLSPAASGGQLVELDPGPVLTNVAITPVMGDAGLKYIAPILADLAWTRGAFSLELERFGIDLSRPTEGEFKGRLAIHSVEAGGKNPLLREIGQYLMALFPGRFPRSIKLANDSVIEFEMKDKGMVHRGLEFGLPDVAEDFVIRTEGWVGFDESLDLTVDIPIPIHLLRRREAENQPPTPGAGEPDRGEFLRLGVGGTLSAPKLRFASSGKSGLEMVDRLLGRISNEEPDDPAASALKAIGALLRQPPPDDPAGPPLGERIIENGLPRVGRFAEKVLKGNRARRQGADAEKGDGDSPRRERRREPGGLLKGIFRGPKPEGGDKSPGTEEEQRADPENL